MIDLVAFYELGLTPIVALILVPNQAISLKDRVGLSLEYGWLNRFCFTQVGMRVLTLYASSSMKRKLEQSPLALTQIAAQAVTPVPVKYCWPFPGGVQSGMEIEVGRKHTYAQRIKALLNKRPILAPRSYVA